MLDLVIDHNDTMSKFSSSFNGSPLDFEVMEADIFNPYSDEACKDKKAVIKKHPVTGECVDWWVVGNNYFVKSHREFFGSVEDMITTRIDPLHMEGVKINTRSSRSGRWGLREYQFPNVSIPVTTNTNFKTDIQLRIVAWSGLDGGTANNYMLGAIDSYCLNGCVWSSLGEEGYVKKYKRNSKLFDLHKFSFDIGDAVDIFYRQSREFQVMAQQPLSLSAGVKFIEDMKAFSKRKTEAMVELYTREVTTRGNNVFSLHSALTNYSSHKNEELFQSRKTKLPDVESELMFKREEEVSNIFTSSQWRELVAA